jgi:predicted transcriptional regulator
MVEQLRERARDLAVLKENLARQRTELSQQKDLVRMRQRDVMQYEEDLAKAREETARELSKLRKMTETLLSQRIKIRDAMQRNQQFEKRLRELEGVQ